MAEEQIGTIAFGFTLGFSFFVIRNALKQTRKVNTYIILVWSEIFAYLLYAILVFFFLHRLIKPSATFFISALILWAIQVQLVLQIIINRIAMIWSDPRHTRALRWGVTAWITLINVSVFCVWLPARLGVVSFQEANRVWDRVEKILFILTDLGLNHMFISSVKKHLVANGLTKYQKLVEFNTKILIVSILMDFMTIAVMSFRDSFLFMQFHPLAYMIKLNIEMEMSNLIVKIIRSDQELKTFLGSRSTGVEASSPTSRHTGWCDEDDGVQLKPRSRGSPIKMTHRFRPRTTMDAIPMTSGLFRAGKREDSRAAAPNRWNRFPQIRIELPPIALLAEDISDDEKASAWSDFLKSPIMNKLSNVNLKKNAS